MAKNKQKLARNKVNEITEVTFRRILLVFEVTESFTRVTRGSSTEHLDLSRKTLFSSVNCEHSCTLDFLWLKTDDIIFRWKRDITVMKNVFVTLQDIKGSYGVESKE